MKDRIVLKDIQCRMRVGVSSDERRAPQACLVDVELEYDLQRAMQTDDLRDTVDYSQVFDLVQGLARDQEFALLERFAGRLEEEVRRAIDFDSIVIRVKKLDPPMAGPVGYAGIEIRRPGSSA